MDWRGGLPGSHDRPIPYGGMFGPSVAVARDERDIHDALGRFMQTGQAMTILVVAPIVASRPFRANNEGPVSNPAGLSIVGLGQQAIYADFKEDGADGLFEFTGIDSLLFSDLSVGTQNNANLPDNVFYLSGCDGVTIRNITEATSNPPASTAFLATNIALTGLRIYACTTTLDLDYSATESAIFGNACGDVTIGSFSSQNRVFGNAINQVADDSASSGNNTLFGNTGNGAHVWTGTGSTSNGDNT